MKDCVGSVERGCSHCNPRESVQLPQARSRNRKVPVTTKLSQNLAADHSVQSRLRMPETIADLKDAWAQFIPSRSLVEVGLTQLRRGVVGKIDTSARLNNAVRL